MDVSESSLSPAGPPATVWGGDPRFDLSAPGSMLAAPYMEPAAEESSADLVGAVLHALRRKWFQILVLGILFGVAGGVAAWYLLETQYTAKARLWVPSRESSSLLSDAYNPYSDFELKKRTQALLISSPSVLESALMRDEKVKNLSILRQIPVEHQLSWLTSCVSVNFPNDAEVMELSVRCTDKEAAKVLADAICTVYLKEEVSKHIAERQKRIDDLRDALDKQKADYRREQDMLARLQEDARAGQTVQLSPEEQIAMHEYEQLWSRLASIDTQLLQAQQRLLMIQMNAEANAGIEPAITDEELAAQLEADGTVQNLRQEIESIQKQMQQDATRYSGPALEQSNRKWQRQIEEREQAIAELSEIKRGQLLAQKRRALQGADAGPVQMEIAALNRLRDELEQKLAEGPAVPEKTSNGTAVTTSIEYQKFLVAKEYDLMQRLQLRLDEAELAKLDDEEEQRRVGIRRVGDVYVMDAADERRKLMQAGAAGGMAFCGVAAMIVLLDMRRRRLNHAGDVSSGLQLAVLGTIPLLRGSGSKRLESSVRLAEAVDGVAAALLCRTTGDNHRVVLISSAMAGEGKTTLAANLATSLASAGRRTVLVDFDLRRPMLHKAYQLPLGPGMGELISGTEVTDVDEILVPTVTEGLWLAPAGVKRQRALAELTDERVETVFNELKERFEFVIVDGPPILPVVDTRLIARHVDGVVMSLLRDVSEMPKVKSACQLLHSYRVRILGGVVIGASGDVYYGYPDSLSSTA